MIQTEPQVAENGRYPIVQASKTLQCNRKTLHKYADYFHIVPAINKVNGRVYFTGKQLLKIWRNAL